MTCAKRQYLVVACVVALLAQACTPVSPVQRARQSRDLLNVAGRTMVELRKAGKIPDAAYRRFYGLWITATDAQDAWDKAVIAQADGKANLFDVESAKAAASKAIDDVLLLQAAFAPPPQDEVKP